MAAHLRGARPSAPTRGTLAARDRQLAPALQLVAQQPDLRRKILQITEEYPPSFLYTDEQRDTPDDAAQLAGFQAFVHHIKQVLEDSPRSQKLRQVQAGLQARYAECSRAGEYLRELYGLLDCPPAATVIDLLDARDMRLRDRGKAHRTWQRHREEAAMGGQLDKEVLERACAGKRAKLVKRGVTAADIEAELDQFVAQLLFSRKQRAAEAAAAAKADWVAVEADPTYRSWVLLEELWTASGAAELCAGALEAEKEEGDERRNRGGTFEATAAQSCLEVVAELLLRCPCRPRHWNRAKFAVSTGPEWRDAQGKLHGEVDLAIMHPAEAKTVGAVGGSLSLEVVAIVEMKASIFEIAAAATQHTDRIADGNLQLVQRGETNPLPLRMLGVSGMETGGELRWVGGVAVFVATLLPPQPYKLGADPYIVRAVSEAIFGRRKNAALGGAPARSWEQSPLSPDDANGCAELMQNIRAVAKAKGHELDLSPRGFAAAACSGDPAAPATLLVMGRGEMPTPSGFATWQPTGTGTNSTRN